MAKKTQKAKRPSKKKASPARATKQRDQLTSDEIDNVTGGIGSSSYYNSDALGKKG
jgi:hypothetical protein